MVIVLVSLSISSVCASDVDNQTIQSVDQITSSENVIVDDGISNNVRDGTFKDLQSLIDNNDVINLTKNFTAKASDDTVEISGSKIINGNGHVLSGNGKISIFKITGGDIVLNNVRIEKGIASDGGAVYVSNVNNLKFNSVIFENNHARNHGGAVYVENGNSIQFVNSKFFGNYATGEYGGHGGAIYTLKYLDITNCSFVSNKAEDVFGFKKTCGGAIYTENKLNIKDSVFQENFALDSGGAIYTTESLNITNSLFNSNICRCGVIYCNSALTVENSIFKKNYANIGGAIYAKGVVFVNSSTFISNNAITDGHNCGGAIYGENNVNVVDSLFKFNFANVDGGAIYSKNNVAVKNSTFDSNVASGDSRAQCCGGAISSAHDVKVDNSTFINNHAEDYGGAIYSDTVTWVDTYSYFIGNYAEDNQGGAIYTNNFNTNVKYGIFIGNQAKNDDGGAIYINKENHITFSNCTFKDNYAADEGGAIYLDSTSSDLTLKDYNSFINNQAGDEGQAVFNKGTYGEIKNNWWGTASPDFSNDLLVEWKFWKSNIKHKDENPLNHPYDNYTSNSTKSDTIQNSSVIQNRHLLKFLDARTIYNKMSDTKELSLLKYNLMRGEYIINSHSSGFNVSNNLTMV